jgi:Ion channel
MEPQSQSAEKIPEGLKIILDSMSPPPGVGNARFQLNWTTLLLFVPYIAYPLALLPIPHIYEGLCIYSIAFVIVSGFLISAFKEHMSHISNPFDFVRFELLNLLNAVVFFGIAYFYLSRADGGHFNQSIGAFDAVYFSFVTIATVGYGDIHPLSSLAKSMVISEIIFGLWFFVTVIPVAVADQAERIRQIRVSREKLAESLRKSLERGELKATEVRNDAEA